MYIIQYNQSKVCVMLCHIVFTVWHVMVYHIDDDGVTSMIQSVYGSGRGSLQGDRETPPKSFRRTPFMGLEWQQSGSYHAKAAKIQRPFWDSAFVWGWFWTARKEDSPQIRSAQYIYIYIYIYIRDRYVCVCIKIYIYIYINPGWDCAPRRGWVFTTRGVQWEGGAVDGGSIIW